MTNDKLRVAVVGCGAVAHAHLPVIREHAEAELAFCVDRDVTRARDVAAQYGCAGAEGDYEAILDQVDAAVLCLPHHLHAPATISFLEAGAAVLVEKPMAMTAAECERMNAAARASGRPLAVGLLRRHYAVSELVKDLLERGVLGRIRRFEVREGFVYDWPVASDFMFRRASGGGVLADTGAHVLDTLAWWLGDWKSFEYADDSHGGVEADCRIELELASGASGLVELSRLRDLPNRWVIEGEAGRLSLGTAFDPEVRLELGGTGHVLDAKVLRGGDAPEDPIACFQRQFDDFLRAAQGGGVPRVSGEEAARSVALIEACHASRKALVHDWASWTPAL